MKEEKTTPLRQRMIEGMHIRGLAETTQKVHIRNVKLFAAFLERSPDTATPLEACSFADLLVVMRRGEIEQSGPPQDLLP